MSDVVLLEPVDSFVQEALARARASASLNLRPHPWKGIADATKSVTILQGTIQDFDPMMPHHATFLDRVGYHPVRPTDEIVLGFDVIWYQWCLGHLSDIDLVAFLRRSHAALRDKDKGRSLIVVKENLCRDFDDGTPCTVFDEQDSSLTRSVDFLRLYVDLDEYLYRSDKAWKAIFKQAGLRLVREQIQKGLPEGLYEVKMLVSSDGIVRSRLKLCI